MYKEVKFNTEVKRRQKNYANLRVGFTLVEILVSLTIIIILAVFSYDMFFESQKIKRDAARKADLRNLQNAIELYKQDNGRYPPQCAVTGEQWSGQVGTDYQCDNGTGEYIEGLAPKYIKALPADPKLNGDDSGYVYAVNTEGTVYIIKARKTVEEDVVTGKNDLYQSCDISDNSSGLCDSVDGGGAPPHCVVGDVLYDELYLTSYGLWGGYADPNDWGGAIATPDDERVERMTEDIVCEIP